MNAIKPENFFFVLGNPRSGTTLLRLMLNNHSAITIPPESGFMLWFANKYKDSDFNDESTLEDFVYDVCHARKFETWGVDIAGLNEYVFKSAPANYISAALLIYQYYSRKLNKSPKLIGDKNNFYIGYLQKIRQLLPESKFIFIVRDGRDVACSYRELREKNIDSIYAPKLPFEIEEIALEWQKNNRVLIQSLEAHDGILVKYEDLISDPTNELTKLSNFLGLVYEPTMLDYHVRNKVEQQEPMEFLKWKEKTLQAPDPGNCGKYQNLLSKEQIDRFNEIAKTELLFFGYEL